MLIIRRLFYALLPILLISNCEKRNIKQEDAQADKNILHKSIALTTDIEKGKTVYFANCVSCHNNNPKKLGSIGPELYGVSIEVLTQKIIYGKYPENYKSKRKSKIMPLMPHLNKEVLSLHAFINSY